MSCKKGEEMEVSMVTEVIEEPQKEQSDATLSEITTLTSSVEVAMETGDGESTLAQEKRLECV